MPERFRLDFFNAVSPGLLEKDRLVLSFLLCLGSLQSRDAGSEEEIKALLLARLWPKQTQPRPEKLACFSQQT